MRQRWVVWGLLLLLAVSTAGAQKDKKKGDAKQPAKDAPLVRQSDNEQIDQAISEMLAAWQIGDTQMLHKYYADDVIITRGDWGPALTGWPSYQQAYEQQRAHTQAALLDRSNTFISVKGNLAWAAYQWEFRGTMDNQPASARGHTTLVFEKRGDRWLIIHNHTSLVAEPPSAAPPAAKKP